MICTGKKHGAKRRSGQAIIFLIMVVVILAFMVMWNFDLHKILYVKSISQNAGDAAALMAARWQGISLNLMGDLNLMHAAAITAGDTDAAQAIPGIQARLCYVGPMIGLMASQQAAKNNGIYQNDDFTSLMQEHARAVSEDYPSTTGPDGEMLFPEPYPGCWNAYSAMLTLVAGEGVAAGPDNARLYGDRAGGHYLLEIEFYQAIASRYWCWFYNNAPELLEEYENFFPCWWPALPPVAHQEYMNSEIFGLGLTKRTTTLGSMADETFLSSLSATRGLSGSLLAAMGTSTVWYCYNPGRWSAWEAMSTTGPDPFPITGPVKPQYDYAGADALIRIEAHASRLTPGPGGSTITNKITWTAAAKPFGYLNEEDRPSDYGLVLPAFHNARLIPVDAVSSSSGGGYNFSWRMHIEQHLPGYMARGPAPSDCWYCRQLLTWENEAFRQAGTDWLEVNSYLCTLPSGPGGTHREGGTRRGH